MVNQIGETSTPTPNRVAPAANSNENTQQLFTDAEINKIINILPGKEGDKLDPKHKQKIGDIRSIIKEESLETEAQKKTLTDLLIAYENACSTLNFKETCKMCQGNILRDLIAIAKRITKKEPDHDVATIMRTYIEIYKMINKDDKTAVPPIESLLTEVNREAPRSRLFSRIKLFKAVKTHPDAFIGKQHLRAALKALIVDSNIDISIMKPADIVKLVLIMNAVKSNPSAFEKYLETEEGKQKFYKTLTTIAQDPNINISTMTNEQIIVLVLEKLENEVTAGLQ